MVKAGESDPNRVGEALEQLIASEPLAEPDYIALVSPDTLEPVTSLAESVTLVALAARFGQTRLIDNALVAPDDVPINRHRPGKG
jgi:pantothenate synthetase